MAREEDRDVRWLEQVEHDRARELEAAASWFGTVQEHDCAARTPLEAENCPRSPIAFSRELPPANRVVIAMLRNYARLRESNATHPAARPPVLLVHGATAWRGTFLEPYGGVVRYLLPEFDVWTLDWRASKRITGLWDKKDAKAVPCELRNGTLDDVIGSELPRAVQIVHERTGAAPHLVGHCIGAAIIAAAIARGTLVRTGVDSDKHALIGNNVVLSTIGLFYRGSVDTWLRAQERLDLNTCKAWQLGFDDAAVWPREYEDVFKVWERTPYPHCQITFCRRISALFGSPYRPNDIGDIHDLRGKLEEQFGVIPLAILNQCARNVRRGWSGEAHASEIDTKDLSAPLRFAGLNLTLITGNENQLWHRESVDRMYEWLRRERSKANARKKVFDNYGHQDLWWSPRAAQSGEVYEYVRAVLSES